MVQLVQSVQLNLIIFISTMKYGLAWSLTVFKNLNFVVDFHKLLDFGKLVKLLNLCENINISVSLVETEIIQKVLMTKLTIFHMIFVPRWISVDQLSFVKLVVCKAVRPSPTLR